MMQKEQGKWKKETGGAAIYLPFFLFPFSFFLLQGCAAVGVAAYKIAGPPAVEAKYQPAKTPMLVLVENYQRQSSASVHADLLARYIADELSVHDVAPTIALGKLTELRETRPDFSKMSISAIAKAAGAAQVLYVQLVSDNVTPLMGGEALQGEMLVRIKVVDAASADTLWPKDLSDGYELSASTQFGTDGGRNVRDVRQKLYYSLADQIVKLFYKWKPEE